METSTPDSKNALPKTRKKPMKTPNEPKQEQKQTVGLLMLHGWPSSFADYLEVLEKAEFLASEGEEGKGKDDEDRKEGKDEEVEIEIDVIVPSLPGYGFSSAPMKSGFGVEQTAAVLSALMEQLGYCCLYYLLPATSSISISAAFIDPSTFVNSTSPIKHTTSTTY